MRALCLLAFLGVCAALSGEPASAAVSQETFLVRTTGDLVALCSASPSDPLYVAAIHFCEGFGVGVFRTLEQEDAADPAHRLFCMTEPVPSRDAATASFVRWANTDPSRLSEPPEDGIADYLAHKYPCPARR
ncbi:MAG TPA: Rap1a/Tai family immunity protein [Acetobacteraceae bacterium]|nr:Rap1a/Tai family immunity protein [Acetobacteraceae bacterium]